MQIKEMFRKEIDRELQGVIVVGQGAETNVAQELEEYVVTRELVAEAKVALETLEKQLVQAQEEYEEATQTAKRSNYICNELFTWADVYDTANHDERRAILQQFIKEIRVRKDYEISITLNASFNQVEQLKAVPTYDGAEIFEGISEKGA